MPLLSRPAGKPTRPRKAGARAVPPIAIVDNTVQFRLGDTLVTALPDGALWVAESKTLVISDVHFEKGASFARRGQMLPPYDTHAALMKLTDLMLRYAPDTIVSLGDSFHDRLGPVTMDSRDRELLRVLMARCDWVWVKGNHDGKSAETLGGVVRDTLHLGALVLRHEPTGGAAPGEIAGHLHPCAKVSGRGRSVRRRCFAFDGERLVMPAFGKFTGGLNLRDEAFEPLFPNGALALVLGKDRVLPAAGERLLSD